MSCTVNNFLWPCEPLKDFEIVTFFESSLNKKQATTEVRYICIVYHKTPGLNKKRHWNHFSFKIGVLHPMSKLQYIQLEN